MHTAPTDRKSRIELLSKIFLKTVTVWVNLGVKIEFITFGQLVQCVLCSMSKPT